MDWLAPLNTALGAAIGVGSTLLADRLRWRRDRLTMSQDARRQAYAAFLGAVSDAYGRLYDLARQELDPARAGAAAHEVFLSGSLYPLRYQLALIGPWSVVEPSNEVFWRVRELRDLVAEGITTNGPQFRAAGRRYLAAAEEAQAAMREDLGTSWPGRDQR